VKTGSGIFFMGLGAPLGSVKPSPAFSAYLIDLKLSKQKKQLSPQAKEEAPPVCMYKKCVLI